MRRHADVACVIVAIIASTAAVYVARPAFAPVLFAVLFALLLSPAVDALRRRGLPRSVGSAVVVMTLLCAIAASANALWEPARGWLDAAPATMRTLERKLRPLTRFIAKIESVSDQAGRMTEPSAGSGPPSRPLPIARESSRGFVANTQAWAVSIVTTVMLTYFLLSSGPGLLARWSGDARTTPDDRRLLRLAEAVRLEVGRYFSALTLSNLLLGIGTTVAMHLLGMPSPLLWGAVAFLLNFIPYAGSVTTFGLLVIVALVSFDGVGQAILVGGTYVALSTLEGQVVQPILVGRRLDLSPIVVFVGLWFGGWLWGIAGIALAVPVLVSIKAALNLTGATRSADAAAPVATDTTLRGRAAVWAAGAPWRRSVSDKHRHADGT